MAGNKVAEVLNFESSLESGRKEAAKRRNKGRENAKSSDVVLEGADKHRLKNFISIKELKKRFDWIKKIFLDFLHHCCSFEIIPFTDWKNPVWLLAIKVDYF